MITEDYCSYEVAKLLKEKGFDWPCHGSYHIEYPKNKIVWSPKPVNDGGHIFMNAPTYQMAIKWLREIYGFHISAAPYLNEEGEVTWVWEIIVIETATIIADSLDADDFDSCEEAVEAALKYCLTELI